MTKSGRKRDITVMHSRKQKRNPKPQPLGHGFFIKTFGCRLNQAESDLMAEKLTRQGMSLTELGKADRVIIHSCAVTKKAQKQVAQFVRRARRENPSCRLWLMGCGTFSDLPADKIMSNEEKRDWLKKDPAKAKALGKRGRKGLVKVQDGCDRFCSYCIVPYQRGRSVSQPTGEVIRRVNQLAENGIDWVVLTGVDIVRYQDEEIDFFRLIEEILLKTKLPSFGIWLSFAFDGEGWGRQEIG